MSMLFGDSFNHYATIHLPQKWESVDPTHVITSGGRFGYNGLSCAGSLGTQGTRTFTLITQSDIGIAGYHSAYPTIGTTGLGYFRAMQVMNGTTPRLTFIIRDSANGNGTIRVLRGDHNGVLLGTSTVPAVVGGQTQHLEFRWNMDATTGAVEIRSEGVPILTLANVDTGNQDWDAIVLFPNVGEVISHFYVLDGSGSRLNYFLGPTTQFETVYPDGLTSLQQWTSFPSGAANAVIDENPVNNDVDFIYVGEAPAYNMWTMADIGPHELIHAIQTAATARRSSASLTGTFASIIGWTRFSASHTPPVAYRCFTDVFAWDNSNDSAWTTDTVNELRAGVYRGL